MPVLIDGHNLVGRLPGLSLQDPDDEGDLVRLLRSYRARTGKSVTVVFDPGVVPTLARAWREGGVEVVFAPHGSSADAVIIHRVRRSPDPRQWLVVSSDQGLVEAVMQLGARVRSADDFAAQLDRSGGKVPDWREIEPSSDEVAWWLALFGQ